MLLCDSVCPEYNVSLTIELVLYSGPVDQSRLMLILNCIIGFQSQSIELAN